MAEVYALDLDEELLSHLVDPESFTALRSERVTRTLIEDEAVAAVYEWQVDHYREHGDPATASVLADEFDIDFAEPLTAVGDLIQRLRDRWVRNNVRERMENIAEAYKEDPLRVVEVLPKVAREITEVTRPKTDTWGTGDGDRAITKYHQSLLGGPGPTYGYDLIDQHFFGIKGLTFLVGAPGSYKSWITTHVTMKNIEAGGFPYLYSLELPAHEADARLRCMAAGVPFWKYLRGSLDQLDEEAITEASDLLDSLGVFKIEKPSEGHRTIEEMVERAQDDGATLILIDQLQYIETLSGKRMGDCDPREFWQPLNKARDLSDTIPIWIVHQFNRTVMNSDSMPEMQQAKGSASIEETATLALGLWANKQMKKDNRVEIGTLKSRHFAHGAWELGVDLTHRSSFDMIGVAPDRDEDE